MVDVTVVCEGQTEREFCGKVIAPSLWASNVTLWGTLVGKPQRKRGGIRHWQAYRTELLRNARARDDRHVAVLVDYYAMPDSWPGRTAAERVPIDERGRTVEEALQADLAVELPGRFHPCVQLHEFETLLFVEPGTSALSIAIGGGIADHEDVARQMQQIKAEFGGRVERINDSPLTAPSKRLHGIMRGYDKVAWGVTAAADSSVETLRAGCPWLDRWLTRLSALEER